MFFYVLLEKYVFNLKRKLFKKLLFEEFNFNFLFFLVNIKNIIGVFCLKYKVYLFLFG